MTLNPVFGVRPFDARTRPRIVPVDAKKPVAGYNDESETSSSLCGVAKPSPGPK